MKSVDLSRFENRSYNPGSGLRRALWYVVSLLVFQSYLFPLSRLKGALLRLFGARIGRGLVMKPNVQIKYPWFLTLGDHVWIGEKVWIDNLVPVTIGSNVCISQGAMLLTGNHDFSTVGFDLITKGINLENGVWIGARAMICPGVRCHSHAVLGVMAVAKSDLEAYSIYFGNPAVEVKKRTIS